MNAFMKMEREIRIVVALFGSLALSGLALMAVITYLDHNEAEFARQHDGVLDSGEQVEVQKAMEWAKENYLPKQ